MHPPFTLKPTTMADSEPSLTRTQINFDDCKNIADSLNSAINRIDKQIMSPDILRKTVNFCFLKVCKSNCDYACSFSDAWCSVRRNREEDNDDINRKVAFFGNVFDVDLLEDFLRCNDGVEYKVTKMQLLAFNKLARFLLCFKETNESLLESTSKEKELYWAAVFGTHVLKKLAVRDRMILSDTGYATVDSCPCGCKTPVTVGDTSIGHLDVWHGCVDILLGEVAISVACTDTIDLPEAESNGTACEHNLEIYRNKIIAQTIVFSFVEKKGLVPTIAVSKDKVKIFMYDTDHDLLYESTELDMFQHDLELDLTTIIALWLVVNYSLFCKGVKPSHIELGYTADLKTSINKKALDIYESKCHYGKCKHDKKTKSPYRAFLNEKVLEA